MKPPSRYSSSAASRSTPRPPSARFAAAPRPSRQQSPHRRAPGRRDSPPDPPALRRAAGDRPSSVDPSRVRVARVLAASLTRPNARREVPPREELLAGGARSTMASVPHDASAAVMHGRADDHVPSPHPAGAAGSRVGERRRVPRALAGKDLTCAPTRPSRGRSRASSNPPIGRSFSSPYRYRRQTPAALARSPRGWSHFRLALDRATRDGVASSSSKSSS